MLVFCCCGPVGLIDRKPGGYPFATVQVLRIAAAAEGNATGRILSIRLSVVGLKSDRDGMAFLKRLARLGGGRSLWSSLEGGANSRLAADVRRLLALPPPGGG